MNRSKAAYLLLLVSTLLMACDNSTHVMLKNSTSDNISINWQGVHIQKGNRAAVAILTEEKSTESFEICRSYGCLATMTIIATEIEEEVNFFELAEITLSEWSKNEFSFNKVGPINVILNNHEATFPLSSLEDASGFEMAESEYIFDE